MTGIDLILAAICINATCIMDTTTVERTELLPTMATSFENQNFLDKLRNDLNGKNIKVATLEDYPLSYIEKENGTVIGKGVSFDIINFLAEKFNFTYDVILPDKNIIGSSTDMNGSLVDVIRNGNADIAAAFVPHLTDLRNFLSYSAILDEGNWIMVMRRPDESATGSGLLAPFETEVWILIIVSLFAVGPIIYGLIILRNRLTGDDIQRPYSLSHCAWFVYGALMKQGSTLSPIADSTRLLFATWWIFITILTSFYTANLTAFLTLSKFTLPFNNVDDIARREKIFVAQRGGGIEYAIRISGETLHEKLAKMVIKSRAIFTDTKNDSETLVNYVEKNDYVYIRDSPAIKHLLYLDYRLRKEISKDNEKIHCPFAVSMIPFMRKERSFVYPKGSMWAPLFEREILRLVESGIVKYLMGKKIPNAEICPQDLNGTERQLRNGDLFMTYVIMLAGFATSIAVFMSELIFRFINARVDKGAGFLSTGKQAKGNEKSNRRFLASDTNNTPPPPYNSLFYNPKNYAKEFGVMRSHFNNDDSLHGKRKIINGRDYMVYEGSYGEKKLVPMRVPSATLFQYSYTE